MYALSAWDLMEAGVGNQERYVRPKRRDWLKERRLDFCEVFNLV